MWWGTTGLKVLGDGAAERHRLRRHSRIPGSWCAGFILTEHLVTDMTWESLFARADDYETSESEITEALRARRGDDA
ncbi:hypothetical protein C440_12174 [Haloferax mucosum ATCC BAA-1512]|uniref:Uncharacterized protein n=1 Tax=Haloferax mucosum ATCC BAA-1512 TaxID=662479 RepID=M0IBQ7_9EURY|nr:hypothetical protein C440_12174 [Haloferax mucosum ATCC BAA-1512]